MLKQDCSTYRFHKKGLFGVFEDTNLVSTVVWFLLYLLHISQKSMDNWLVITEINICYSSYII